MAEETVVIYNIRLDRLETVRRHIGELLTKNNPSTWRMANPADSAPIKAQDSAEVTAPQDGSEVIEKPKKKRRKRRTKAQMEADRLKSEQEKNEQSNSEASN